MGVKGGGGTYGGLGWGGHEGGGRVCVGGSYMF